MTEETDATQAAEAPVPDETSAPSPDAVDTSDKSVPKQDEEFASEKVQKRINKLTGRWRQAESDAEYWRARAQQAERVTQPAQEPPKAPQAKKLADFNYDEEAFTTHVMEVAAEKAAEKAAAKLRESQERERTDKSRRDSVSKFRESEAKVKAEIEDYEDFAYTARIDDVAEVIMAMDEGPRIAYYLGKNPETAARINALPPHLAAVELGRIDAKLANEREQAKAKSVSKAPPPTPKIEGANPGSLNLKADSPDSDALSDEEWARRRNKQVSRRS